MSDFSTVVSRMLDESNNIISILRFLSSCISTILDAEEAIPLSAFLASSEIRTAYIELLLSLLHLLELEIEPGNP